MTHPVTPPSVDRVAEIVRTLARAPRPAGGEAEAAARAFCAERLTRSGFAVTEEPFDYSALVGRWGTPLGGVVGLSAVVGATRLAGSGRAALAFALLTVTGVALAVIGQAAARHGVLSVPLMRRRGVNLAATRGSGTPRLWLMAHLDSKSQPVPILARAAGITVLGAAWMVGVAAAALQVVGMASPPAMWTALALLAAVGALPVIATTVGSRSPGALDNATGVAVVLAAAEASSAPVGVCLTSAEELGLAGARAWVRGRPGPHGVMVINCDSFDDTGTFTAMWTRARPTDLIQRVSAAATRLGGDLRAHRLLPGILTDGVALADAGWTVVTLSQGGLATLARIHTARDDASALTLVGATHAATVVATVVAEYA